MHRIALAELTATASSWPLKPNQSTLVFIHGAGFHGGFWQRQTALAEDFNLVFINLPGREGSPAEQASISHYASQVLRAIQSIPSVILIGHSMGGAVVQQCLIQQPENVDAAVLACTGARLKVAPVVIDMLKQGSGSLIDQFAQTCKQLTMTDLLILGQQMADSETSIRDFFACNSFDVMEKLGQIQTPCLIIVGDSDVLTPEKYSQYLATSLADSRLVVVKGVGHLLPWEATERFNQALTEFAKQYEPDAISTSD